MDEKMYPPYEIGGKLNEVKQGGSGRKEPPVSLREPSPLLRRGDTASQAMLT
jgi:hypothetical protein